jgi:hypothetical protein
VKESALPWQADISEAISFFAPLTVVKILQDDYQLKEYIRSDEFAGIRRRTGDLCAVDAIFRQALKLSWNNVYEALLISSIGTFDHRNFGVRLPLVGPLLWVPLTSEFADDFQARVDALPSRLYPDTPPQPEGDRDKLQHFFGSAFLTYLLGSREAAERFGSFIEWGEQMFVVDGQCDDRDLRADREGQDFGLHLLGHGTKPPSTFLSYAVAERPALVVPRCIPGALPDSVSRFLEER